jgi:hypothetical protein
MTALDCYPPPINEGPVPWRCTRPDSNTAMVTQSVQLVLDLAKVLRELWQRRRKSVVQFRDLELGDIQLDADACPQAP